MNLSIPTCDKHNISFLRHLSYIVYNYNMLSVYLGKISKILAHRDLLPVPFGIENQIFKGLSFANARDQHHTRHPNLDLSNPENTVFYPSKYRVLLIEFSVR